MIRPAQSKMQIGNAFEGRRLPGGVDREPGERCECRTRGGCAKDMSIYGLEDYTGVGAE
jgi:hypothetical protein